MARVSVQVNAKNNTSKGLKGAESSIKSLGRTVTNVKKLFVGFLALKGIQQTIRGINDTVDAFQKQQRALSNLTASIGTNANASAASLQRIIKFTGQLQKNSIYGDEMLQEQAAFLSNMQLTEDQIKDTLTAAAELATAGIGTLESNVRELSKTFNGNAGRMAQLVPGMKELTEEQLRNGEAVALINERYEGLAQNFASNTLAGRSAQASNVIGDIKEQLGGIFAMGKMDFLGNVMPVLEDIQKWLEDNQSRIVNFFMNLPEIAAIAFDAVWQVIRRSFTLDYWVVYIQAIGNLFVVMFKGIFNTFWSILQAVGTTIWEPLTYGFRVMISTIRSAFNTVVDSIQSSFEWVLNIGIRGINRLRTELNKMPGINVGMMDEISLGESREDRTPAVEPLNTNAMRDAWKNVADTTGGAIRDAASTYVETVTTLAGEFSDITEGMGNDISGVLNRELPDHIKNALDPTRAAIEDATTAATAGSDPTDPTSTNTSSIFDDIASSAGGLSDVIGAQGAFGQALGSAAMSLGSVAALGSLLAAVFHGVLLVIGPAIDGILKPLIGRFVMIGMIVGTMLTPQLKILELYIKATGLMFIFFHNYALRPLANAFIFIAGSLVNFFVDVFNSVRRALNRIPGVNISRVNGIDIEGTQISKINEADLSNAGGDYMGATGGAGGRGASFTGSGDTYVNIHFNHSYINGDGRQIALMLRDEIDAAVALGY